MCLTAICSLHICSFLCAHALSYGQASPIHCNIILWKGWPPSKAAPTSDIYVPSPSLWMIDWIVHDRPVPAQIYCYFIDSLTQLGFGVRHNVPKCKSASALMQNLKSIAGINLHLLSHIWTVFFGMSRTCWTSVDGRILIRWLSCFTFC